MIFSPTKTKDPLSIKVKIEGEELNIVQHTKFLGIIVDNSLNWKQHISYITTKISKSIGILSRARSLLNATIMKQLYYSFLYPYISYCNIIWGKSSDQALWPLFKIQKRAIRIIYNLRQRDSTKLAFKQLKILRLPELNKFTVLILCLNSKTASYQVSLTISIKRIKHFIATQPGGATY